MSIVTVAEAKTHLNIPASDTSQDTEIQGFIDAAQPLIEDITGPVATASHTEYFDGGCSTIVLSWLPVVSVTSVTEYYGLSTFPLTNQPLGSQTDAFGYTLDAATGQITRRTFGGEAAQFAAGAKNVKVVYTAGLNSTPGNVRLAALELIRHLWQQSQQGGRPRFGGNAILDGENHVPIGFALPDRVVELLAPNRRPPGVA